jgi:hypothetical protein
VDTNLGSIHHRPDRHPNREAAVTEDRTSFVVQAYLDELAGGAAAEPIVRALLDRAARRLHRLCAAVLHRGYHRLPCCSTPLSGNPRGRPPLASSGLFAPASKREARCRGPTLY